MAPAPEKPQKILVIKLSALGDFVQALGPMVAIRRHHPEAEITLLTTDPFITIGRECGYFDHIITDRRPRWHDFPGWYALRRALNQPRFGRVYDLQNNDRTAIYQRLITPRPEWFGAARRSNAEPRQAAPALQRHKHILARAGITDVALDDLSWVKSDISGFSLPQPYVLLVPGCAPRHPYKRWPAEKYGALARNLHGWGYLPVIIGTQQETPYAQIIKTSCPAAHDLTGQTTVLDIPALARGAAGAIGNDTGPMHLIAPTGCPALVLFSGHSDPARHAPLGPVVITLQQDTITDIKLEQVLQALPARTMRQAPARIKD